MIDRDKFWAKARAIFHGLSQSQVDGTNAILDAWESRPESDLRWLAYELATAFWETARTMKPIEEYGKGAGHSYGIPDAVTGQTYYGRGYVQLTWKANYDKMSGVTGVDLVDNPGLALDPKIAAVILFEGMEHGDFTGVGLPKYFSDTVDDPVNARRIINGTDHASDIAGFHRQFLEALT